MTSSTCSSPGATLRWFRWTRIQITWPPHSIKNVVRLELREKFEPCRNQWLAWDKWSGHIPGLFKLEFDGDRAIALCNKAYYVDGERSEGKKKHSAKEMSARHNDLTWGRYKATL